MIPERIFCESEEQARALMEYYEKQGFVWNSGSRPTLYTRFNKYKGTTYQVWDDRYITFYNGFDGDAFHFSELGIPDSTHSDAEISASEELIQFLNELIFK